MPPQVLTVVMHGRRIGTLTSKGSSHVELVYDDDAIGDPTALALSMSMPLIGKRYRGAVLANWVQGLLPDRPEVLRRWRRDFGIRRLDVFSLLWFVGEDIAGAAQFIRPERLEAIGQPGALSPVTIEDIATRLRALRSDQTAWAPSPATGQFSLAGAQAKFALHQSASGWAEPSGQAPTTHIFKPAIPNLADQDIIEHLTMRTASLLGLAVPSTAVTLFGDERALVVQRFDRARTASGWVRVHQEDMCQAAGVSPANKYEEQGGPGVVQIVGLIRQAVHRRNVDNDVGEFLRAVGFNWLVVGTDAHAKNYGLLHAPGQSRLAPLYDLNSYLPYGQGRTLNLSMKVGPWQRSADRIRASEWIALAEELNLDPDELISGLQDMAERLPDAAQTEAAASDIMALNSPMAAGFVDAIASRATQCVAWLARSTAQPAATRQTPYIHPFQNRPQGWNAVPLIVLRTAMSIMPASVDDVGQLTPSIRDALVSAANESMITNTITLLGQTLTPVSAGPEQTGQPVGDHQNSSRWTLATLDPSTPHGEQVLQTTRIAVYRLGTDARAGLSCLLTVRTPDIMTGGQVLVTLDVGVSAKGGLTLTTLVRLLRDSITSLTNTIATALVPILPHLAAPAKIEIHWAAPTTSENLNRPVPADLGVDFTPLGKGSRDAYPYGGYSELIHGPIEIENATGLVLRGVETVANDCGYFNYGSNITALAAGLATPTPQT